ncbi:MAG: hypothetical protein ACXVLQ_12950 [Bacteriovorax sp.]
MGCEKYLEELRELYKLNREYVEVEHVPMSERYTRAQSRLRLLLRDSECIGFYDNGLSNEKKEVEVVTWLEPNLERFTYGDCGEYAVYKTLYMGNGEPKVATLFCIYDGFPDGADSGNNGLRNKHEALELMKTYNKYSKCE